MYFVLKMQLFGSVKVRASTHLWMVLVFLFLEETIKILISAPSKTLRILWNKYQFHGPA